MDDYLRNKDLMVDYTMNAYSMNDHFFDLLDLTSGSPFLRELASWVALGIIITWSYYLLRHIGHRTARPSRGKQYPRIEIELINYALKKGSIKKGSNAEKDREGGLRTVFEYGQIKRNCMPRTVAEIVITMKEQIDCLERDRFKIKDTGTNHANDAMSPRLTSLVYAQSRKRDKLTIVIERSVLQQCAYGNEGVVLCSGAHVEDFPWIIETSNSQAKSKKIAKLVPDLSSSPEQPDSDPADLLSSPIPSVEAGRLLDSGWGVLNQTNRDMGPDGWFLRMLLSWFGLAAARFGLDGWRGGGGNKGRRRRVSETYEWELHIAVRALAPRKCHQRQKSRGIWKSGNEDEGGGLGLQMHLRRIDEERPQKGEVTGLSDGEAVVLVAGC